MAELLDWSIVPNDPSVKTVVPDNANYVYDLLNLTCSECIQYGQRTWGINLVWGDPAKKDNIRFQRQPGSKEPLKFEEPVAIYVRGGGFLIYKERKFGINLGWSYTPKFEWKILGGTAGTDVPATKQIGVFNTVANDSVMYEPRDFGINLKWFKDSGKYDSISKLIRAGKDVKDIWESF